MEGFLRDAQDAILASQDGVIHPQLISFVTRVCASTRDLAFHVDFACSLHGSEFARMFAAISGSVKIAITSAVSCLNDAGLLLKSARNETWDTISHYSASCSNRLERLDSIERGDLFGAFRKMSANLPYPIQEDVIRIATSHDGFLLTSASWLTHRLVWVVCELGLESGPYVDALRQQLAFLEEEASLLNQLKTRLSKEYRDDNFIELKPQDALFLEDIRTSIDYIESCALRLKEFLRIDDFASPQNEEVKENEAKQATQFLLRDIVMFVSQLEKSKDEYCVSLDGTSQPADELSPGTPTNVLVETETIRVLLVDENLNCEERRWSAIGLDIRVVGFGNTEAMAIASVSKLITLELAFRVAMDASKTNRISPVLLSKFESAVQFCTDETNEVTLNVRKL